MNKLYQQVQGWSVSPGHDLSQHGLAEETNGPWNSTKKPTTSINNRITNGFHYTIICETSFYELDSEYGIREW